VRDKLGVNPNNISINYNAIPDRNKVEASRADLRRQLGLKDSDFVILNIGRLRIQKAQDTLLKAIPIVRHEIPNLKVMIVGEGELWHSLIGLSNNLKVDDIVTFVGGTSHPEMYMNSSDIFVLPSVFEGLPTVVLEAFRSSIPVIASDIDGTNELIRDGINGLLFETKDHQALASCIVKLFSSHEFRESLSKAGQTTFQEKYNITAYAKQLESLYSK
jgi:glycosyltransferase involved in cell wall biosynthesis